MTAEESNCQHPLKRILVTGTSPYWNRVGASWLRSTGFECDLLDGRPHGPVHDLPSQLMRTEGPGHSIGLATQGVNSGQGFAFVSHTGDVYPSGFLPASAGNLRDQSLKSMYQDSELFRELRRPWEFKGVCGICEFNKICGGSRSRAFALTGDYLESDPWCVYRPASKSPGGKEATRSPAG